MQKYSFGAIKILKSSVDLDKLIEELGGEDNVEISTARDNHYWAIKSALIDEALLRSVVTDVVTLKTPRELAQEIIDAHDKSAAEISSDKLSRISEKKTEMNTDLYNSVYAYFGTTDREAAGVWERSWQVKRDNAASYVSDGLVVMLPTTTYPTPGTALDTEAKILAYYGELITERVIPFDKYRDQRVTQFLTEKAVIEAE